MSPTSPNPAAEQDLLALIGTINGLKLDPGLTNNLDNSARAVGDQLAQNAPAPPPPPPPPHGSPPPPPPSPSCQQLSQLKTTVSNQTGKKNGLTAAQAQLLTTSVAHIAAELGC